MGFMCIIPSRFLCWPPPLTPCPLRGTQLWNVTFLFHSKSIFRLPSPYFKVFDLCILTRESKMKYLVHFQLNPIGKYLLRPFYLGSIGSKLLIIQTSTLTVTSLKFFLLIRPIFKVSLSMAFPLCKAKNFKTWGFTKKLNESDLP